MMEQVGTRQQQRCLTFPVTITPTPPPPASDPSDPKATTDPSDPKAKKKRKIINSKPSQGKEDTKPSREVKASSNLVAKDVALLEHFPSRRNYPFGRDRTSDSQKQDFPRTNKSCRVLFKHMKKHGLGFVLDLELDEVQMDFLLVVSWNAFGGIDCSEKFHPHNSLQRHSPKLSLRCRPTCPQMFIRASECLCLGIPASVKAEKLPLVTPSEGSM
jgi:hypothetical protein